MNEIIELVYIIEELKKDEIDFNLIDNKIKEIKGIIIKYPKLDWDFLNDIRKKDKNDIENWINICIKTVHVL